MEKELLAKITNKLKENNFSFSLEAYISGLYYYVRGVFVYNCEEKGVIKQILDGDVLKNAKLAKTYVWYLGDRKPAVVIDMKKDIQLTVPEFEAMQTDNYGEDSEQVS